MSATKRVSCVGCKDSKEVKNPSNIGDVLKETGYEGFTDVGDGLTFRYLCPGCVKEMTPALTTVFRLTGNNEYAHWSNLLSICGLRRKGG